MRTFDGGANAGYNMHTIAVGPLVFATDTVAAIAGIAVFLTITSLAGRRVDPQIDQVALMALAAGVVLARLGYVAAHASTFSAEPWRVLELRQGGFSIWWGLGGAALVIALRVRSKRPALWLGLALGISLSLWNGIAQLTSSTPQTPLPSFTFDRVNGGAIELTKLAGKPVVINLWASWCPPCRREMPLLARVASSETDVTFAFINQGEDKAKIQSYLAAAGLSIGAILLDPLGQTANYYRMAGLPTTLFIGADGKLRSFHTGELSPEDLED